MPLHPASRQEFVDHGIEIYDWRRVDDIAYSTEAKGIVAPAFSDHDQRQFKLGAVLRKNRSPLQEPVIAPEIVLPDDIDTTGAVIWLGKAAIRDYGGDFMVVDTLQSTASNRASDHAVEKLHGLKKDENVRFALVVREQHMEQSRTERLHRVQDAVNDLVIPTMNVVLLPFREVTQHYAQIDEKVGN